MKRVVVSALVFVVLSSCSFNPQSNRSNNKNLTPKSTPKSLSNNKPAVNENFYYVDDSTIYKINLASLKKSIVLDLDEQDLSSYMAEQDEMGWDFQFGGDTLMIPISHAPWPGSPERVYAPMLMNLVTNKISVLQFSSPLEQMALSRDGKKLVAFSSIESGFGKKIVPTLFVFSEGSFEVSQREELPIELPQAVPERVRLYENTLSYQYLYNSDKYTRFYNISSNELIRTSNYRPDYQTLDRHEFLDDDHTVSLNYDNGDLSLYDIETGQGSIATEATKAVNAFETTDRSTFVAVNKRAKVISPRTIVVFYSTNNGLSPAIVNLDDFSVKIINRS